MIDDKNQLNSDEEDGKSGAGGAQGRLLSEEDTDQGGSGSGSGSQSGEIQFRYQDPLSSPLRDDALPAGEIKRLLSVQKDKHKQLVDKQRLSRKERKALKEGRKIFNAAKQFGLGGGGQGHSRFKKHPITNKAQFSGMDQQVIGIPSENTAESNAEQRNELENRLQNRLRNAPKFNPKPTPF